MAKIVKTKFRTMVEDIRDQQYGQVYEAISVQVEIHVLAKVISKSKEFH